MKKDMRICRLKKLFLNNSTVIRCVKDSLAEPANAISWSTVETALAQPTTLSSEGLWNSELL